MARSWQDVKADKEQIERAAGRDVDAARAKARALTQAYLADFEDHGVDPPAPPT